MSKIGYSYVAYADTRDNGMEDENNECETESS
ncbi:hypothetical protein BG07_5782 (plasmid) [Bacillus pseudomycoides]|nr:hypothetical protein DJ92_5686 [Bacillus pseudomycoides]AJI14526.1 hypothetical protein BG07_5782 [Bacillus pseudomycoides]